MKNLIFCSYAYVAGLKSSTEKNQPNSSEKILTYLKCCVVSLVSAKTRNPGSDVALVTNIDVPNAIINILKANKIILLYKEFDSFRFESSIQWSLAFYKLCVLKYVVENFDYDNYLLVDSDTYFISEIKDLWTEAEYHILLLDLAHNLSISQTQNMNNEYMDLYKEKKFLLNYGGEFICGNRSQLKHFIKECQRIHEDMISSSVITKHGDEFIICIAAERNKDIVKNAAAYVSRYWTGRFYLVSTNY